MEKRSEELKVGNLLVSPWCGNKIITGFREYTGPLDFVDRIVEFHDGTSMSLEKGRMYETGMAYRMYAQNGRTS